MPGKAGHLNAVLEHEHEWQRPPAVKHGPEADESRPRAKDQHVAAVAEQHYPVHQYAGAYIAPTG